MLITENILLEQLNSSLNDGTGIPFSIELVTKASSDVAALAGKMRQQSARKIQRLGMRWQPVIRCWCSSGSFTQQPFGFANSRRKVGVGMQCVSDVRCLVTVGIGNHERDSLSGSLIYSG